MDDDGLPMWTIYEYPSDYPQGYVVRRGVARATGYVPDTIAQYAPTLEAAMRSSSVCGSDAGVAGIGRHDGFKNR
jgi:hypothetical protein